MKELTTLEARFSALAPKDKFLHAIRQSIGRHEQWAMIFRRTYYNYTRAIYSICFESQLPYCHYYVQILVRYTSYIYVILYSVLRRYCLITYMYSLCRGTPHYPPWERPGISKCHPGCVGGGRSGPVSDCHVSPGQNSLQRGGPPDSGQERMLPRVRPLWN